MDCGVVVRLYGSAHEDRQAIRSQPDTSREELAGSRHGGSLGGCVATGYGEAIQADYGSSTVVNVGGETERLGRRRNC